MLNAMINKNGTVELQIYSPQGGIPKKQTNAIPLSDFTPEYVEKEVSSIYNINPDFKEGIKQFVDSVQKNG